jgi:anti-sigma factor RsiW
MSRVGARVAGVALQDVHLKPCKSGKVPLAVRKQARRQPQGARSRPGLHCLLLRNAAVAFRGSF